MIDYYIRFAKWTVNAEWHKNYMKFFYKRGCFYSFGHGSLWEEGHLWLKYMFIQNA